MSKEEGVLLSDTKQIPGGPDSVQVKIPLLYTLIESYCFFLIAHYFSWIKYIFGYWLKISSEQEHFCFACLKVSVGPGKQQQQ